MHVQNTNIVNQTLQLLYTVCDQLSNVQFTHLPQ